MKHKNTFLGIGWKFPPEFDNRSKTVTLVSEEEDIKESLFILFSTRPGERMMQPEYGCDLSVLNFEPVSTNFKAQIEGIIQYATLHFEPRIILEGVEVSTENYNEGVILIHVDYTVRKTNKRNNIVFPYYLIEGTDVTDMPI